MGAHCPQEIQFQDCPRLIPSALSPNPSVPPRSIPPTRRAQPSAPHHANCPPYSAPPSYLGWQGESKRHLVVQRVKGLKGPKEITIHPWGMHLKIHSPLVWGVGSPQLSSFGHPFPRDKTPLETERSLIQSTHQPYSPACVSSVSVWRDLSKIEVLRERNIVLFLF